MERAFPLRKPKSSNNEAERLGFRLQDRISSTSRS
jgi:hypothetical protein